jgi:hypothetical protein
MAHPDYRPCACPDCDRLIPAEHYADDLCPGCFTACPGAAGEGYRGFARDFASLARWAYHRHRQGEEARRRAVQAAGEQALADRFSQRCHEDDPDATYYL